MQCPFDGSIVINKILNYAVLENSMDNKCGSIFKMFELDVFLNNKLKKNDRNRNHTNIKVICPPLA